MDDAHSIQPNTASARATESALPCDEASISEQAPTHEASPTCPEIATPDGLKADYRFLRALGQGAQSKVFLAERLADHQKVAIKQLRIDSIKTWKEYTLFHREAEVLATLDIPGVVKLYEARDCLDFEPPCSYIVQEYIEGPTLKEILASGYRFSLSQTYDLILQLIEILKKLHSHDPQVIHRDIKPSNIILRHWDGGEFEACLLDFGAVSNPKVQSGGSTIAGTFGYMSPEQLIGRAEPASDTYALAALTAYLLSGIEPAEMTIKDLRLIIDPYIESHPRALVQMLRQMLEPALDKRLSDLDKVQTRIQEFKDNHYTIDKDQNVSPDPQQFTDRLQEVHHLCQPQNMELWQELPDTPDKRPKISKLFVTHPRFQNYPTIVDSKHYVMRAALFTVAVILILCIILAFLLDAGFVIGFFTGAYIWPLLFFPAWLLQKVIHSPQLNSIRNEFSPSPKSCPSHLGLYQTGLKTIATITQISFVPCDQTVINAESNYEHPRIEAPPIYSITYKFNPPDDYTPNDIFHTIHTHTDPETLFKIGDPLPILYQLDEKKKVAQSMPFPLPFSDMNDPADYIYQENQPAHSL